MKLTEDNVEFLRNAFTESKDWLLRDFPKTIDLPFELVAELLLPHIPDNNTTLRYLGGGYTRAKVLLFRPRDSTPFVVKFGPIDAVREQNSHLGKRLPFFVRPERIGQQFVSADGKHASFAYSWAGGYDSSPQLRETVSDVSLQTDGLIVSVLSLMKIMMRWSSPRPITNKSVFDLWNWAKEREDLPLIRSNLQSVRNAENSHRIAILDNIIEYRTDWLRDVPVLATVVGLCHGDLNCRNIIVSGPREHLSAKVIDLSDIKRHCPAYDWARLERDVKLLCLRDASPDAAKYAAKLEELNHLLDSSALRTYPPELDRYVRLILAIREKYEQYGGETAKLDYLYMLLCWNIAHLNSHQWQSETSLVAKSAIINSAYHTVGAITSAVAALRNPAIKSSFLKAGTSSLDRPLTRTLSKLISFPKTALGVLKEHAVTVNIIILFLAGLIGYTLYDRVYPYKFIHVEKNEKQIVTAADKIRLKYSTSTDTDFWTRADLLFMNADEFYSLTQRDGLAEALEEFGHRPAGWQISEYEESTDDGWSASVAAMRAHSSDHDQTEDYFHIDFDAVGNPFLVYIPSDVRRPILARNPPISPALLAEIVAKRLFGFTLRSEDAVIRTNVTWFPGVDGSNTTEIKWTLPDQTDERTRLIDIVIDENGALVYAANRQQPRDQLMKPLYVHHDARWPLYVVGSALVIFILIVTSVYLFFHRSLYKKISKAIVALTAALVLICLLAANIGAQGSGLYTDDAGHFAVLSLAIDVATFIFLCFLIYVVTKTATEIFVRLTPSEQKRDFPQSTMNSISWGTILGAAYSATTISILFILGSSRVLSATNLAVFLVPADISIEFAIAVPVCVLVAALLGIAMPVALLSPRMGRVRGAIAASGIWAVSGLLFMPYDAPLVVNMIILFCLGMVLALSALWGGLYSLGATAITVATVELDLPVFRVLGDAYPQAAAVFIPLGGLICFAVIAEFMRRFTGKRLRSAAVSR